MRFYSLRLTKNNIEGILDIQIDQLNGLMNEKQITIKLDSKANLG